MEATHQIIMKKTFSILILLLATVTSVALTACGGDDDEPANISITGKLNTVSGVARDQMVTVDVGCQVHVFNQHATGFNLCVGVSGGEIVCAGDFQDLSSVTTAPLTGYSSYFSSYVDRGCYIVKSNTGSYIRMKITPENFSKDSFTFQFQTFKPTNI